MSSPIAHTAAAYAVYSTFRRKLPESSVLGMSHRLAWPLIVIFISLLPDLDVIAAMTIGSLEKFHNNLSHSLAICTAAAVILAPLLRLCANAPLGTGFLLSITCCYSHILIDFFTRGRGIMLFWPFTEMRYHAPVTLFIGVPWSSGLTSPLYLKMIINDLGFAAVVVGLVAITRRFRPQ